MGPRPPQHSVIQAGTSQVLRCGARSFPGDRTRSPLAGACPTPVFSAWPSRPTWGAPIPGSTSLSASPQKSLLLHTGGPVSASHRGLRALSWGPFPGHPSHRCSSQLSHGGPLQDPAGPDGLGGCSLQEARRWGRQPPRPSKPPPAAGTSPGPGWPGWLSELSA